MKKVLLGVKGKVDKTVILPALVSSSEIWPMRSEDFKRLQVFDHRYFGIGWLQRVRYKKVLRLVLGNNNSVD